MSDVDERVEDQEQVPESDVEPDSSAEGEPQDQPVDVKALQEEMTKLKENYENVKKGIHQEREEKKQFRDQYYQLQEQLKQQQPQEEPPTLSDDDYPTWGQVQKYVGSIKQEIQPVQQQQKQYAHQAAVSQAEQRFMAEHSDYAEAAKAGIEQLNKTYSPQQIQQMYYNTDPALIPQMLYGLGKSSMPAAPPPKPVSQPKTTGVKSKSARQLSMEEPPIGTPEYDEYIKNLSPKEKAARDWGDVDIP